MEKRIPVACTLGPTEAVDQLGEWQALQRRVLSSERIDGGVRLRMPAELHEAVDDLARREQDCCRFLSITVTVAGTETVVEITSEQQEAGPVIDLLTGTAPS